MTNSILIRSLIRGGSRVFLPALLAVLIATLLPAARTSAQAGAAPATICSLSGPYTQTAPALPGGGAWFTGPVGVTLSATPGTGGGGVGTYYTADGGAVQPYQIPFSLTGDGPHTLTFYSQDAAGDVEAANAQALTIDTTPPITTPTLAASSLTLSATDAVSGVAATYYVLDGGSTQPYSQPVPLATGATHQIRFWSVDWAGNRETAQALTADRSAPTTTASVSGPTGKGGWYLGAVQVTLSATDPDGAADVAATDYTLDGGAQQTYTVPLSVSGDGTHSLVFWSVDQAGNAEAAHTLPLKIDGTAPALTFGAPTPAPNAAGWARTAVSFPWTATDPASGVSGAASGTVTVKTEGLGQTQTVLIADAAGNSQTYTTPPIGIDLTPPATTVTLAPSLATLSATDALSGVAATYYVLDGAAQQTYAAPVALPGAVSHVLTFWSVDQAGNTEARHTQTVAAVPVAKVVLTSSVNPAAYGQAVTLTAAVTSMTSPTPTGSVTFSDGSTALGTAPITSGKATLTLSTLSVGAHSLTAAYGGDARFGPAAGAALSQTVKQSGVAVGLTSSAPSQRLYHSVTFTAIVSAAAPGAGTPTGVMTFQDKYAGTLATVPLSAGQASFSTTTLSAGAHVITAVYGGDADFVKTYSAPLTQTMTAVKIMPMGDGLTWGYCTKDPAAQKNGGYRGPLYSQTVGQGWAVQYVGGVVQGFGIGYCEGHCGQTIAAGQAREPALVTQYAPDVILLQSGIDDLEAKTPASQMLANMGTLLDALSAAKPGVQILVASLTPLDTPQADLAQENTFNAGLPDVVNQAAAHGDNVSFVDMNALCAWAASDYQPPAADGVHPNSSGYAKMAAVWYNTLAALPLPR